MPVTSRPGSRAFVQRLSTRQIIQPRTLLRFNAVHRGPQAAILIGASPDHAEAGFDSSGKLSNARFGYADWKTGHRIIQLALKFYF